MARADLLLDLVRAGARGDYALFRKALEALVAEATLLTALIGQAIKLRWKLSLQIRGSRSARLIATDYFAPQDDGSPARIRAYASYDADNFDPSEDPIDLIGEGYFAILIDQGQGTTPYQGLTPIAGASLAACAIRSHVGRRWPTSAAESNR